MTSTLASQATTARFTPDKRTGFTLPEFLRSAAASHPDKVAMREMSGSQVTYAELLELTERRAAGLAALGVGQGDRVLLLMDNSIDLVVSWFATNLLGAVQVGTNTACRGTSLVHIANNSGAEGAIIDDKYADAVAADHGDAASGLVHVMFPLVFFWPPVGGGILAPAQSTSIRPR